MSISLPLPKRGEVWRINFDPTIGAEIKKVRPAIVISSDAIGILPIKLVAPITTWNASLGRPYGLVYNYQQGKAPAIHPVLRKERLITDETKTTFKDQIPEWLTVPQVLVDTL